MPRTARKNPLEAIFEPTGVRVTSKPAPSIHDTTALDVTIVLHRMDEAIKAIQFSDFVHDRWTHFRDRGDCLMLTVDAYGRLIVTYRVITEDAPVTRGALEHLQQPNISLDKAMRLLITLDLFWD